MLLKRLLLRCAMRQLLVKQSTIVRNGSRKRSFVIAMHSLPFDFIRSFSVPLARTAADRSCLGRCRDAWGVRMLDENMYLCQAIEES